MNPILSLNQKFEKVLKECPEITFIGNPVLRRKTSAVATTEGVEVAQKLKDLLSRYRSITGIGRGLAAPQIGESKSVFVTYVGDAFTSYLNPKIVSSSANTNWYRESCISCGFLSADVERSSEIEMTYEDENGDKKQVKADGFLARLLQHEYDHLQGIINIDRAEKGSIEFATRDPLKEVLRVQKETANR